MIYKDARVHCTVLKLRPVPPPDVADHAYQTHPDHPRPTPRRKLQRCDRRQPAVRAPGDDPPRSQATAHHQPRKVSKRAGLFPQDPTVCLNSPSDTANPCVPTQHPSEEGTERTSSDQPTGLALSQCSTHERPTSDTYGLSVALADPTHHTPTSSEEPAGTAQC